MSVFVDGSTLSALFYSHANSDGNQEGLLLGQTVSHVKDHISDSQINNAQVQTYMYVSSHIPWPNEDKVYSRGGIPIIEKLAALLGDSHNKEEVVGWYSFRRNSTLRMSMKECTIHKHLESRFSQNICGNFLFFLCVESVNGDCTTFSIDYCFFLFNTVQKKMKKVLATITNLGDTLHTQYKTHGHASVSQASAVKKIVQQLRYNFVLLPSDEMAEVKRVSAMSNTLSQSLLTLSRKVAESELKTGELEGEVQRLREELRKKEEACRALHRQQALESSGPDNCQHQAIDVDLLTHQTDQTSGRPNVRRRQRSAAVVTPSIDDLLSMPGGPFNLDVGLEPVPHCSYAPVSSALEIVMDSIADSDDDELTGCPVQPSKGRQLTRAKSSCGAKEKDVNLTTVASIGTEKLKTGDHFAFVNSLMTEKNGSLSDTKTGQESKGFTKIHSRQFTRSTRSQTKNSIDALQTKVTARSAGSEAMAGVCSDHTGSPSLQGKRQLEAEFESFSEPDCRRLPEKVYNTRSGGGGEASGRYSDPQGSPVSRSRAQVNSTKTNLVVRHRSRSEASADRAENIQETEVKKCELVPQQNGSGSPDNDILDPLKLSSSPIF